MESQEHTTKKAAAKPAAEERWLDFRPPDWDAIGPRQAYYLAGRFWRRYQFYCQQRVTCSHRLDSSNSRLSQLLPGLNIDSELCLFGIRLLHRGFVRLSEIELRLAFRNAVNRFSPQYRVGIQTKVDALLERHFLFPDSRGPFPWTMELDNAVESLQQAVEQRQTEQERTLLARELYATLVFKFATSPFAELSSELLWGATKADADLFQVGDQLEKGHCRRDLFEHVRTSEFIPNSQRRWTDIVLADRWLAPAKVPPTRGWSDNLKDRLRSAGLNRGELQLRLAECETAIDGEPARVPELVEQLHDLIMAALAPAAVSPVPSGHEDEQVTSPSLGVTLTRRRIEKHKKREYKLFRTRDEEKPKVLPPQAGEILWLLFKEEEKTGTCRLEWKEVEGHLDATARGEIEKGDAASRRRTAFGRLNASLKKFNLQATKEPTTKKGAPQYLIISKTDSSN